MAAKVEHELEEGVLVGVHKGVGAGVGVSAITEEQLSIPCPLACFGWSPSCIGQNLACLAASSSPS